MLRGVKSAPAVVQPVAKSTGGLVKGGGRKAVEMLRSRPAPVAPVAPAPAALTSVAPAPAAAAAPAKKKDKNYFLGLRAMYG